MSGLGDFWKFFVMLMLLVLISNVGQSRGGSEDYSDDSSRNVADLVSTYQSIGEKTLGTFMNVVGGGSSSSSSNSSENKIHRIGKFISSHIPKPMKQIIEPVKNKTARSFGEVLNHFGDKSLAIFPGTLWCGAGNIAKNDEDLGLLKKTDACCRAHDKCPSSIDAGASKGRLLNDGIFTRSLCPCDLKFYTCLKGVNFVSANKIGQTYFNILRPQCFSYDYPIKFCAKYERLLDQKCLIYDLDESQNKTLSWFDNPDF